MATGSVEDERRRTGRAARLPIAPAGVLYLVCGALWVAAGFVVPGFASFGHIRYMLELSAFLGIAAAGQTLVIIAAGIDLSVGAVITFAAIIGPLIGRWLGLDGVVPVVLILAVCGGFGVLNGVGVSSLRIHPLIMTLASATIMTGILLLVSHGTAASVRNPVVLWMANGRIGAVPVDLLIWLAVAALTLLFLHRTVLGTWTYALGTNPRASELSGVNRGLTQVVVFGASGFTAGLSGTLLSGVTRQGYIGIGDPYLLTSIAAVVIGGTSILGGRGSYLGTIAGAILLVTITSLITVINASAAWRNILLGLLVLALLALYARESRR